MKVKRMIKSDVDTFKVGDIIKVKLTDGVKVQAMAMQQEEDGMIFCLVDCLPGEYPMNSTRTNEGGYEESDLRKKLNGEILNLFPVELTDMMIPFDNGDLLRLPTEKEIFGENYYLQRALGYSILGTSKEGQWVLCVQHEEIQCRTDRTPGMVCR